MRLNYLIIKKIGESAKRRGYRPYSVFRSEPWGQEAANAFSYFFWPADTTDI